MARYFITGLQTLGPKVVQPGGYMTKYQDELQSPHGNVHFASADWANGWRAAIDGALEQGFLTSRDITKDIRQAAQPSFTAKI